MGHGNRVFVILLTSFLILFLNPIFWIFNFLENRKLFENFPEF